MPIDTRNYEVRTGFVFDDPLAQAYLNAPVVAFDIETDTDDYHWQSGDRGLAYPADITFISLYAEGLPALVLRAEFDWIDYSAEILNYSAAQIEEHPFQRRHWYWSVGSNNFIKKLFSMPKTFVAHNLVFDARQIYGKFGIEMHPQAKFWDTQVIQLTGGWEQPADDFDDEDDFEEDEARTGRDLYALTAQWLTHEDREWWQFMKNQRKYLTRILEDEKFRTKRGASIEDVERYSALDSIMAYHLYVWQMGQPRFEAVYDPQRMVAQDDLETLIEIDLEYIKLCVEMSAKGMRLNIPYIYQERNKYLQMWVESLARLGLTPEQGDLPRSSKWRKDYILGQIEEPTEAEVDMFRLKTKKGAWSFGKIPMAFYLERYPQLFDYKRHVDLETKLRRLDEFMRHAEYDGRIHSAISRIAVTGRNTSSSPNVQNLALKYKQKPYEGIPELDIGLFIPDEDDLVWISLDCSNAENWMGAMYSRDNVFAAACAATDFHKVMAQGYFAQRWEEANSDERAQMRNLGKTITFGTAYGMGVKKLAWSLRISVEEAQQFLDNKDRTFPQVARAKKAWSEFAEQSGYAILWTGRRVGMRKRDGKYKGYTAWNSLAQGGVGEMIVRGMVGTSAMLRDLSKYDPRSRVVSQVHDEVIIQISPNNYPYVVQDIIEVLATVVPDIWNERTTPACRWLFDLDNVTNAHKWGFVPGKDYLLPIDEYINRWGVHKYEQGQKECPIWINEYGSGEQALARELGTSLPEPKDQPAPEVGAVDCPPFDWATLRQVLMDAVSTINPFPYEGRIFDFPAGMELRRALCHTGNDMSYLEIIKIYDTLAETMDAYKNWKENGGGRC